MEFYFVCAIIQLIFFSVSAVKDLNQHLFTGEFEFIDLSHGFDEHSIYWPGNKEFSFLKKTGYYKPDGSWYASNEFCAGEHGGTHIDAPYHFNNNGSFVSNITLDHLILPLILVDISDKVKDNPDFVLERHHLDYMINNYFGKTEQPCLIVFKFGWSKFYSNRQRYLGYNKENGILNFPGISADVARWLLTYKNIVGIGMDVASVDPGSAVNFDAHKILLGAGKYVLENVKLDQYIPDAVCTALVMPMKITKGTGAPLRLVAICPKEKMSLPTHSLEK